METQNITWTRGDRLAKARRLAGVSTAEMAMELAVDRKTINNYEADRTRPNYATLRIWSDRCGVPLEWLTEAADDTSDGGTASTRWDSTSDAAANHKAAA